MAEQHNEQDERTFDETADAVASESTQDGAPAAEVQASEDQVEDQAMDEAPAGEPETEALVAEEPPAEAPAVEAPAAEEPVVEGPVAEELPAPEAQDASVEVEPDAAVESAADGDAESEPPAENGASEPEAAAEPEANAEPEAAAEPEASAEPETPERPTAVSLGLLPEEFVSQVSTALHFYAPDVQPLPALPAPEEEPAAGRSSRRRRRRGGAEGEPEAQAAPVEESTGRRRQRVVEVVTEPQRIKGSTRLEAKKQRRRDGREAGRRRPVVTEAEFLARREAVDRQMIVRSKSGRVQIAVLEDNVLVEHYVARSQDASLIGNVYLGRVQNVLPSMEAAFVDIGRGRNAVLYSGEVDWDSVETGNQPRRIELALKPGDKVLVQVTKDPVGHKGARLTSQISLPGRYLVYVPGGAMNGISRKLPDTERSRLKKILKEVLPESSGVIVRTAAEGATEEQLTRDVNRLTSQWAHINSLVEKGNAPSLLHSEPDLLVKIVRDVFNEDFTKMLIQGEEAQRTITSYLEGVAPDLLDRIEKYEDERDPFDAYRITEQIEKALDRKVWLPSGGSLVIDRTEAMTVVDVNTGKFVGSGGNLEETVTKNNLEAAEEIVRQLRLRDIGGIIVVDFIDMVLESNRDLVLRRLVECLSRDRTKHQVAEVTSLGLVQMTRKKLGLGLLETFSEPCEVCAGRGVIVHHDPVAKHRPSGGGGNGGGSGSGSGRRSRGSSNGNGNGGNGNGNGPTSSAAASTTGTHVITEGVKSALAQIAASTIHPAEKAEALAEVAIELPEGPRTPAKQDAPKDAQEGGSRAERPKKGRRKRQQSEQPKTTTDTLLDSVLNALPEPKAPGQGRSRSRRVTTAALTGTAVPVTPVAVTED
ncbi:Rne/Rng family ribonuclease [Microbacterium sp. JZ31]|uniref:Rne/Rng family ribonuclease n=1 Tax=Microbacterium sp. JZ31 TaxID=1906274 RepID=UPI001933B395|nr:Rne/Rng family ribonuclease [Microbacterium sp. JZ31]